MLGGKRSSLSMRLWRRWIPELDLFPLGERGRVLSRAMDTRQIKRQMNLSLAVLTVVLFVTADYLNDILRSMFPSYFWTRTLICGFVLLGLCFWVVAWPYRTRIRRNFRQELVRDGFPICVPCGYDLRGLAEPRCPECGAPFDEQLLNKNA